MRYAEAQFAEEPHAVGIFETGDTVTVEVIDASADTLFALSSNVATELTNMAGVFTWPFSNLTSPPVGFTEVVVRMTNANGRQHLSKMVIGGFPSDSAIARYNRGVTIDTINGTALSTPGVFEFPIGAPDTPVSNITDARTIADELGFQTYYIVGGSTVTLNANHLSWIFQGASSVLGTVDPGGFDVSSSAWLAVRATGNFAGSTGNQVRNAPVASVTNFQGTLVECGVSGTFTLAAGTLRMVRCQTGAGPQQLIIDFQGVGRNAFLSAWNGRLRLDNLQDAGDEVEIAMVAGDVETNANCTAGSVRVTGVGGQPVVDGGGGATVTDLSINSDDVDRLLNYTGSRGVIDITTNPWQEIRYVLDRSASGDTAVFETWELYDQDGNAIAGNDSSGNNPLNDSTRMIAERRRI